MRVLGRHVLESSECARGSIVLDNTTLATRMAHGTVREFDPKKESTKDFRERFGFYCVVNGIAGDNEDKKKAMFITLLGQETFAKLKILASPTAISELSLDAIVQFLTQHFRPTTIEIKFFKRQQNEQESAMEY